MFLQKIFSKTNNNKVIDEYTIITREELDLIYYFLKCNYQLDDPECRIVMQQTLHHITDNIGFDSFMTKEQRKIKFLKEAHKIAKHLYPKELEVYHDSKKSEK